MNSFHFNSGWEKEITFMILACLRARCLAQGVTITLLTTRDEQLKLGDFRIDFADGRFHHADLKAERETSPNLFYETESHSTLYGPGRPGWGRTLETDRIYYYFDEDKILAMIDFPKLKAWLDQTDPQRKCTRVKTFTPKVQEQHEQKNRTEGHLVPFKSIPSHMIISTLRIGDGGATKIPLEEFLKIVRDSRDRKNRPGKARD